MPSDALTRPTQREHYEWCETTLGARWRRSCAPCDCGADGEYAAALERYATALEGRVNQPFPDGSYDIPLDVRLRGATTEFSHPRLGIVATNKHAMPITTEEAKELLSLRTLAAGGHDGESSLLTAAQEAQTR